jgi:hypothetical protein
VFKKPVVDDGARESSRRVPFALASSIKAASVAELVDAPDLVCGLVWSGACSVPDSEAVDTVDFSSTSRLAPGQHQN